MTKEEFATKFQITLGTPRDWKQGKAEPDQSARAYPRAITGDAAARAASGALSIGCFGNTQALTLAPFIPTFRGMDHLGGCHCGNIHVRLRLSKRPEDNALRECTCSFCRSHRPRMVADPEGQFEAWADDWSLVENYRFGTSTCDFLICRRCGVFIAAVTDMTVGAQAVVNVNCLQDRERFNSIPALHEFEGETLETRASRRAANWMPAIIRR